MKRRVFWLGYVFLALMGSMLAPCQIEAEVVKKSCSVCGHCTPQPEKRIEITAMWCDCCNTITGSFTCQKMAQMFRISWKECDEIKWVESSDSLYGQGIDSSILGGLLDSLWSGVIDTMMDFPIIHRQGEKWENADTIESFKVNKRKIVEVDSIFGLIVRRTKYLSSIGKSCCLDADMKVDSLMYDVMNREGKPIRIKGIDQVKYWPQMRAVQDSLQQSVPVGLWIW